MFKGEGFPTDALPVKGFARRVETGRSQRVLTPSESEEALVATSPSIDSGFFFFEDNTNTTTKYRLIKIKPFFFLRVGVGLNL